ncbi:hypothetical protein [Burkholderia gladioli]|uniref:hypothetical protein n=1 Tax=Burkholderia gladioli TaxID=28095 RepID=UPI0016410C10|nr:hypothetical protein [Burkholderia gladioli]
MTHQTIPIDITELTTEGVDIALSLIADLRDGAATGWAVMGPHLESNRWQVQIDETSDTWMVEPADFAYSGQDESLPRAVARALLTKHVLERHPERYVLAMNYARAKALFQKSPSGMAVVEQLVSDGDTVELELHTMHED